MSDPECREVLHAKTLSPDLSPTKISRLKMDEESEEEEIEIRELQAPKLPTIPHELRGDGCPLLELPFEISSRIYRYIVISPLDCNSHPRLWRPLGVDGGISRIGYFERDAVIPLLLACRKVHDHAATVLYGENTFAFHISGLAEGPISFLEWLAPKYVKLLRKVYVRTGYDVDTYGFEPDRDNRVPAHTSDAMRVKAFRDLAISIRLMRHALPAKYNMHVNKQDVATCSREYNEGICRKESAIGWPASSYHLWKMFVIEDGSDNSRREFRRIRIEGSQADEIRENGIAPSNLEQGLPPRPGCRRSRP